MFISAAPKTLSKIAKLTPMVRFETAPDLKQKIQQFRKPDNLSKTK